MNVPIAQQPPKAVMTETQAAEYLQLSPRTLQSWRVSGDGPRFFKAGRNVRYRLTELESWIEAQSASHTSEVSAR